MAFRFGTARSCQTRAIDSLGGYDSCMMSRMTGTTPTAKRLLPFFEALARAADMTTRSVKLSISKRNACPETQWKTIRLPDLDDDLGLYARTFIHELRHARDIIDGIALRLTREQMEERARIAETTVAPRAIDEIAAGHRHLCR